VTLQGLLIIFGGLAAGGLVKGVTGLGLPLIAVPVIAGALGVQRAVLVMIIPGMLLNAWQAWTHRDCRHEIPELPRLLMWGLPGAAIGAGVLYLASERVLASVLAGCIAAYLFLRYMRPDFKLAMATRKRIAPVIGLFSGALQTSTGISAPLIGSYMHALGLQPRAYVFAVAVPFGSFAAAHFTVLSTLRLYTTEVLMESMLAVVPAVIFIRLGERLRVYVQPRVFDHLIRIVLALISIRLLYVAWV
jgi:uncharacterized membrane protein YfcA